MASAEFPNRLRIPSPYLSAEQTPQGVTQTGITKPTNSSASRFDSTRRPRPDGGTLASLAPKPKTLT